MCSWNTRHARIKAAKAASIVALALLASCAGHVQPRVVYTDKPPRSLTPLTTVERERLREGLFRETNLARKREGLPALKLDWNLEKAAQAHAEDMAKNAYFSHTSPSGDEAPQRVGKTGYLWRRVAENIAFGDSTPKQVIDDWLNSPGHRRNLLNPEVRDVGFGVAVGPVEKGSHYGTIYFVQNLGRKMK